MCLAAKDIEIYLYGDSGTKTEDDIAYFHLKL